jgi:pimeloyl-ACP methyl ester carboxylesterase
MSKAKPAAIPESILKTSKLLQLVSPYLATRFGIKLFSTPVKFKTPNRERSFLKKAEILRVDVPQVSKTVQVYKYGSGPRKALLVHGWSGRGSQMHYIAENLGEDFTVFAFDGPAHGKSTGKTTNMSEFISSIEVLSDKFGPFEVLIGHSIGGMAVLNSVARGVETKSIITIGAADTISEIASDFAKKVGLSPKYGPRLKKYFDKKLNQDVDNFSAHRAAKSIDIKALVIHDEDDMEVSVSCARNIRQNLSKGTLLITQKLGHTTILRNREVALEINKFLNDEN